VGGEGAIQTLYLQNILCDISLLTISSNRLVSHYLKMYITGNYTYMSKHKYNLKIFNGRIKIYVDDYVMFSFNQIDFRGYYAYKDDTDLYGLDIYLISEKSRHTMEIYFKTKENWLGVLKLLDEKL
jgi:hypothetical protein